MRSSKATFPSVIIALLLLLPHPSPGAERREYSGCCDASASAVLNADLFAAASDEDSILRLYPLHQPSPPLRTVDLSRHLAAGPREEADLEAAARLDELVFWIGSHSRTADGKARPARHVLFATEIRGTGTEATLVPVGRVYRGLVPALLRAPALSAYPFAIAARLPAEDEGGLNIEGLAAGPDGSLWIAFRNPVPRKRALIVRLRNPRDLLQGQVPVLDSPVLLDLQGNGFRDFAWTGFAYLILAGPAEGGGRHRLWTWSGDPVARPVQIADAVPKGYQAEAILVHEGDPDVTDLLSDEGNEKRRGRRCEEIADPAGRAFGALRVHLNR